MYVINIVCLSVKDRQKDNRPLECLAFSTCLFHRLSPVQTNSKSAWRTCNSHGLLHRATIASLLKQKLLTDVRDNFFLSPVLYLHALTFFNATASCWIYCHAAPPLIALLRNRSALQTADYRARKTKQSISPGRVIIKSLFWYTIQVTPSAESKKNVEIARATKIGPVGYNLLRPDHLLHASQKFFTLRCAIPP